MGGVLIACAVWMLERKFPICCIAGFQLAAALGKSKGVWTDERSADWNRRYSRFETCATIQPNTRLGFGIWDLALGT
jgi:hypothetical protein